MVHDIDKRLNYSDEEELASLYLEPIPAKSFIRQRLVKLFIQAGLASLEAQVLLSLILHGGKMKTLSLVNDLNITLPRLLSALPTLEELGLTIVSHHRPKSIILAIPLAEVIQRLASQTLGSHSSCSPEEARLLLTRLDQLCIGDQESENNPLALLNYFNDIQILPEKVTNLFFLLDFALSSLFLSRNASFVLAMLIANGGCVLKRDFFKEIIKPFSFDQVHIDTKTLKSDLQTLNYSTSDQKQLSKRFQSFYGKNSEKITLSGEQDFNILLEELKNFCQLVFSGYIGKHRTQKKGKSRSTVLLVLVQTLTEIADTLFHSIGDFYSVYRTDIQHLQLAMKYVKFIDPDIFQITLNHYDSFIKKLERELFYAEQVRISYMNNNYLNFTLERIIDCKNTNFSLDIIINEQIKDNFVDEVQRLLITSVEARGINSEDNVTFVSPFEMLDGNILILTYKAETSSFTYFLEISPSRPVTFTTLPSDVENNLKAFKFITEKQKQNSLKILELIEK